jgi:hypothetical protein
MDIREQVYDTLLNLLVEEHSLSWVEPIFVPGDPCFEAYAQMHTAYARLRQKLGATDEDPDAEAMISALLDYSREFGLKMFEYGMEYQRRITQR